MSPNLPARLGRYEVMDMIGIGAFATVFRAHDDRLDTDVAVKVLAENHSFDPDLRERFISEGHLLRRVACPNVVTVFDLDETDTGRPFLVLELATGGDLRSRRRAVGPSRGDGGVDEALAIADQLAAALEALHAERVVHRDVSPGNLLVAGAPLTTTTTDADDGRLLAPGDRLMLADLGLSKDLAVASGLTVGAGTAGFTPPEQGEGGWIDPRADIWSASALLVWVALGREPDAGGHWSTDLRARGWPEPMVTELTRALAPTVEERHPSATAWIDSLHVARSASGRASPAAASPTAEPGGVENARSGGPSDRRARGRWRSLLAAAVLLVALAAGGGWWLGHRGRSGAATTTEALSGGRVRARAGSGDLTVAAIGPVVATVGRTATYVAQVSGASHFVWLAPDGQAYVDEPNLAVRPTSSGRTTVRLVGLGPDGEIVTAELPIEVRKES